MSHFADSGEALGTVFVLLGCFVGPPGSLLAASWRPHGPSWEPWGASKARPGGPCRSLKMKGAPTFGFGSDFGCIEVILKASKSTKCQFFLPKVLKYEGFDHPAGGAPETPYKNIEGKGAPNYTEFLRKFEENLIRA